MGVEEWLKIISQTGFPIALSIFLLYLAKEVVFTKLDHMERQIERLIMILAKKGVVIEDDVNHINDKR